MPALRKTSRKSRTSTPLLAHSDEPSPDPSARHKSQRSLDVWFEPTPKQPEPSFQEQGFARHGVVEGMAPLGVKPTERQKARVRKMAEAGTRRSLTGKNGALLPAEEGVSTPEMTPGPDIATDDSAPMDDDYDEDLLPVLPAKGEEEEEDEDWVPVKSKGKAASKTPVRGKPAAATSTPAKPRSPVKESESMAHAFEGSPMELDAPDVIGPLGELTAAEHQRLWIIVNHAASRLQSDKKPHVAAALREIVKRAPSDDDIYQVFQSFMHGDWNQTMHDRFYVHMKAYKKLCKKQQRQAERESARDASLVHTRARDAKPTNGYVAGSTVPSGTEAYHPTTETAIGDISEMLQSEDGATPSAEPPGESGPHPLTTVPALAKRSASPPPRRMPSKSPQKQGTYSTVAASNTGGVVPSSKAPTPDSIIGPDLDSGSDLSDVDESIVQSGPPEPLPVTAKSELPAVEPPAARKIKLTARGGKKSRASSVKPPGRQSLKIPTPTVEDKERERDILRLREQMAQNQLLHTLPPPPMSETRFEDELMETESLTSSQIAVGPPVDSIAAPSVKPSRPNINLTWNNKRWRPDDSSALPSPQLDSAVSTRPTTPVIAPPAAKRIKLTNGQAARTKRSPTKNREGPIAGIPHGGAARHLGSDDNDPASPPLESDDFCSACKGAGEFVCCDNCTRVYHFLCCDPPRLEPPTGSFLCHECEAKQAAAEAPVSEAFRPFGPLLRQLRTTNTRAFTLPFEIRDYFDGVSARKDGSYGEDVKKFPLAKNSGYGYQGPDYLKTHDANGKPILCAKCGKSSMGKRQILKCDYCPAYWHLDCCDPPLANPPPVNLESSSRDAWKCPRHVDHDFRTGLVRQKDLNSSDDVHMLDASYGDMVTRKVRKPKHPSIVESAFTRTPRNNGLIEIINDSDDETDGEGNYVFPAGDMNSKMFSIPEKGIVLDFVSKVKNNHIQQRKEQLRRQRAVARLAAKQKAAKQDLVSRSLQQQQTALYLAQFAGRDKELGMDQTNVEALCLSLTAEAPQDVVNAVNNGAAGAAEDMTDEKRAGLMRLRALIDKALATDSS